MIPFHSEAIGLTESGIEAIGAEFGGGICNPGTLTLKDSIATENYARGGAGVFNGPQTTIENSTISGNRTRGFGSAIFNGGIPHVSNILIKGNVAGSGAGISNWAKATIVAVTFDGNRSRITAGGVHNNSIGVMTLDSSTISNNESAMAGGTNNWRRLVVINSTISNNRSNHSAGIESRDVLTLPNSTVTGNAARERGGLVVQSMVHNDGVSMSKTILAGNAAEEGPDCLGIVSPLDMNPQSYRHRQRLWVHAQRREHHGNGVTTHRPQIQIG